MKHPLRAFFVLLFVAVFIRLGNSCAFSNDEDVFVQPRDPDAPYAKYVAGRIGVLQPSYRIRHLVVAWNTLSGRGLTPAEQKAAIDVDAYYNTYAGDSEPITNSSGSDNPPIGREWEANAGGTERKAGPRLRELLQLPARRLRERHRHPRQPPRALRQTQRPGDCQLDRGSTGRFLQLRRPGPDSAACARQRAPLAAPGPRLPDRRRTVLQP